MIGTVYQLICPVLKRPIYVGSTTTSLRNRMSQHRNAILTSNSPLYQHIRSVGVSPKIEPLEYFHFTDKQDLLEAEHKWIKEFKLRGEPILNLRLYCPRPGKPYEIVNLNGDVVRRVAEYCSKNFISIGEFIEEAATEKLDRQESINAEKVYSKKGS